MHIFHKPIFQRVLSACRQIARIRGRNHHLGLDLTYSEWASSFALCKVHAKYFVKSRVNWNVKTILMSTYLVLQTANVAERERLWARQELHWQPEGIENWQDDCNPPTIFSQSKMAIAVKNRS